MKTATSGRGHYISRTDGGLRKLVEEWKVGWTAGGLRKHSKYCYYVGSASSSFQLFLSTPQFYTFYVLNMGPLKYRDFYSQFRPE